MWLRKGEAVVLVPEHMPDTITRCLGDGWAEVPDPRTLPAPTDIEPQSVATLPPARELEQHVIRAVKTRNAAARAAFADMGMGPKPKGRR